MGFPELTQEEIEELCVQVRKAREEALVGRIVEENPEHEPEEQELTPVFNGIVTVFI